VVSIALVRVPKPHLVRVKPVETIKCFKPQPSLSSRQLRPCPRIGLRRRAANSLGLARWSDLQGAATKPGRRRERSVSACVRSADLRCDARRAPRAARAWISERARTSSETPPIRLLASSVCTEPIEQPESVPFTGLSEVEPAGIEPATSCLQIRTTGSPAVAADDQTSESADDNPDLAPSFAVVCGKCLPPACPLCVDRQSDGGVAALDHWQPR
jgi:hypothetical protein